MDINTVVSIARVYVFLNVPGKSDYLMLHFDAIIVTILFSGITSILFDFLLVFIPSQ